MRRKATRGARTGYPVAPAGWWCRTRRRCQPAPTPPCGGTRWVWPSRECKEKTPELSPSPLPRLPNLLSLRGSSRKPGKQALFEPHPYPLPRPSPTKVRFPFSLRLLQQIPLHRQIRMLELAGVATRLVLPQPQFLQPLVPYLLAPACLPAGWIAERCVPTLYPSPARPSSSPPPPHRLVPPVSAWHTGPSPGTRSEPGGQFIRSQQLALVANLQVLHRPHPQRQETGVGTGFAHPSGAVSGL